MPKTAKKRRKKCGERQGTGLDRFYNENPGGIIIPPMAMIVFLTGMFLILVFFIVMRQIGLWIAARIGYEWSRELENILMCFYVPAFALLLTFFKKLASTWTIHIQF